MAYYSHVLFFPNAFPFDHPDYRWPSFVGEFVVPLVQPRPTLRYWFSYYGQFAKFRVDTNNYEELSPALEERRNQLQLTDHGEEKDLTLVGDLGHARFLAADRQDKAPEQRASLVLNYLHAISELVIDNLLKRPDNYWELEHSGDHENPLGNNFESLAHLLANMSRFQFDVAIAARTSWMPPEAPTPVRCYL